MINAEKSLEQSSAAQATAKETAALGDHSGDSIKSQDMVAEEKRKHSDSSSSSESGSDKSGKSHSDSGSEDESSDDESDEKHKKSTTDVTKEKSGSKSPDHAPGKTKEGKHLFMSNMMLGEI